MIESLIRKGRALLNSGRCDIVGPGSLKNPEQVVIINAPRLSFKQVVIDNPLFWEVVALPAWRPSELIKGMGPVRMGSPPSVFTLALCLFYLNSV